MIYIRVGLGQALAGKTKTKGKPEDNSPLLTMWEQASLEFQIQAAFSVIQTLKGTIQTQ